MKRFMRIFAFAIMTALLFSAVSLSANQFDTLHSENEMLNGQESLTALPIYLTIEGADENETVVSGIYPIGSNVNAATVTVDLLAAYHPDRKIEFNKNGEIEAIDGFKNGTFGGEDAWHYIVKYYRMAPSGEVELLVDIPTVPLHEYPIVNSCSIVIYYGEPNMPIVNVTSNDDGKIMLVTGTPKFDSDGKLSSFEVEPLANGVFTFTSVLIDEESGEASIGKTYSFTADENGVLRLSVDFKELPNGYYYGSAGKDSDIQMTLNGKILHLPAVIRSTDLYLVNNETGYSWKKKLMTMLMGLPS